MCKLAIDGGKPIRQNPIDYGGQWIDEDDVEAVVQAIKSPLITTGPKVKEAEKRLSRYTGARYAVITSNCTAALHCACLAAGIKSGDEVITTPLTFAASANCVLYCGGKPVFADVRGDTYNIDPDSIERKITDKTKAVIAVDFTGQVVELEKIKRICESRGLILIEDAAHAIGSRYKGKMVGSIADMTCFSFHPVKTITSGEGGCVTTNDDNLYKKIDLAHNHGIERDKANMLEEHEGPWYYEQVSLGYNYRMTDFQAALLISQLEKIEKYKERRKEIIKRYNDAFSNLEGIILQKEIPDSDSCKHLYIIRLDPDIMTCTRRQFYDALICEGIIPQIHYVPIYWFPYYQRLGYKKGICPVAEEVYNGIMSIPLFPRMTNTDVDDVIRAVEKVYKAYS